MDDKIPVLCTACAKRFQKSLKVILEVKSFSCPGCGGVMTPTEQEILQYMVKPLSPQE
jgi:predicted RNA-binding Zn-ribbon protein involved in translation (DUF1610 family)